jgi:hypothetical protein
MNTRARRGLAALLGGIVLALAAAGCGAGAQDRTPLPVSSGATGCGVTSRLSTAEQCECLGGAVRPDPGMAAAQCTEAEETLGRVSVGLENGLCCAPTVVN